ncbi:MAG: hypothetical protein LBQ24_00790 [Candidatus Peribacteria bacterium]|jgi:hypothetical protein|nr:hypothetical protein [Candidatus Peribacteria bacterium]
MSPYVKKGNIYYREGQRVTPPFNISQKKLIELLQSEFEQISFPDEFKEFFVN